MGIFDTIRVKQVIKCPACGVSCRDFQTKQLDNCLDVYKEGTTRRKVSELKTVKPNERNMYGFPIVAPTNKYHYELHLKNRDVLAYDYCKCGHFVYQSFRFDSKGRLKRVGQPEASKR